MTEVKTISFIAGSFDARSHETGDRSLVGQSRPLLLVVKISKTQADGHLDHGFIFLDSFFSFCRR